MSGRYLARRLAQLPLTVATILLTGFLLVHLAPGDPVVALAGQNGDTEYYALVRREFGLDLPLPAQLASYIGNVSRGNLGTSYVQGRPVLGVIGERMPATLLLTGTALALSTLAGITLGVFSARRHGRWPDTAVNLGALGVHAAPVFLLAQLAILWLTLSTGWFPVQGMSDARIPTVGVRHVLDVAHHLALPVLALATQDVAAVSRLTRVGLLDELRQDHVRTARGKGVAERRVIMRHALPRALLPVVTVLGGRVGHLVAGAVVVESVFGWPGLGRLLVSAMQTRDAPVLLGVFLLVAATVAIANLLTDLLYAWLDPRVRYR